MTPNCDACNHGDHPECAQRGQTRQVVCECQCETATQARRMLRVDQETGNGIPNYALLDLWMALGHEPNHEFDDAIAVRGKADVWAYLLAGVRDLNNRGAYEAVAENGDPLYLRAKAAVESLAQVRTLTVDVARDEEIRNARGELVHGTLEATITIAGLLP